MSELDFPCCEHCGCDPTPWDGHDDTCNICQEPDGTPKVLEKGRTMNTSVFQVNALVHDDGTGYFLTCPRCHFYKNAASKEGNTCRNVNCTGTIETVRFQIIPAPTEE